jgi:phage gpG-like protein
LRSDLLHNLGRTLKTASQQEIQVGQQPWKNDVYLDQGLKLTQRSDGMTESLIPVWWSDVVAPEAFNDVADVQKRVS